MNVSVYAGQGKGLKDFELGSHRRSTINCFPTWGHSSDFNVPRCCWGNWFHPAVWPQCQWRVSVCSLSNSLLWPNYYITPTNACKPQILVFISHNLITFLKGHMMAFSTFQRQYGSKHEGIHSHCYTWIWTNWSVIIKPWKRMYDPEYLIQMSNDGFLKCCQQFGRA